MPEPRRSIADLETALAALALDLEVPAAPALSERVASRLLAERAAAVSRPLPRRALWTPRTRLVLATLLVLAILAIAAGARFVIGAVEIRVVPTATPTPATPASPPFDPAELGAPVPLAALDDRAGFDVEIPVGRAPDVAYVSSAGDGAVVLAWTPDDRSPALPGTPWGLVLVEIPEPSDELLVKSVSAFEDTDEITLDGERASWIHAPHALLVVTQEGDERFHVEGNVLVWERDGVTYRLETPLGLEDARAIAGSMR